MYIHVPVCDSVLNRVATAHSPSTRESVPVVKSLSGLISLAAADAQHSVLYVVCV